MESWERNAIPSEASNKRVEEIIHHALSMGINHIDTARGYGTSEKQIGYVLKNIERKKYLISTKVTPKESSKEFVSHVRDSISLLSCDYLDILYIHGINNDGHIHLTMKKGGTTDTAYSLQKDGIIRHVGFSTHGDPETIQKTIDTDRLECVSLHYYFLMQQNLKSVIKAREKNMGISIISPCDKGGQLHRASISLINAAKPFEPHVLSDLFCLTTPGVHTVNIGAEKISDINVRIKGIRYLNQKIQIDNSVNRTIETMLHNLSGTFCTSCYECEPCPLKISIPETLRLRNIAVGLNMLDFARWRYNMFEQADHWFPGRKPEYCDNCGECISRCPEGLNIPELIHETCSLLKDKPSKRLGKH